MTWQSHNNYLIVIDQSPKNNLIVIDQSPKNHLIIKVLCHTLCRVAISNNALIIAPISNNALIIAPIFGLMNNLFLAQYCDTQ